MNPQTEIYPSSAHAKGRGDGDPAVRVRDVDTLGQEHFAEIRTAHHKLLIRIISSQRRQRTDHLMSYAKAVKKAQCESVERTFRERRFLFAGGVQRTTNEWLTSRVMFETMAVEENLGQG